MAYVLFISESKLKDSTAINLKRGCKSITSIRKTSPEAVC